VELKGVAAEAGEAAGQTPARQKVAKLPLDEAGQTLSLAHGQGLQPEGLEVLEND
jgi:hypothetical protein